MASRRSTLRCASCRATYWSDDAHRCEAVKPRRWRKIGQHEYALRMGPVTVSVIGADRTWRWHAVVEVGEAHKTSATILREWDSTPRAQCQADAIAAVERWRDGIR